MKSHRLFIRPEEPKESPPQADKKRERLQEVRIALAGLSALGIMAEYEEIANISAGIGSDIAKRDPGPKETV